MIDLDLFDRTYQPDAPSKNRVKGAKEVSDFYDTLDRLADDLGDLLTCMDSKRNLPLYLRARERIAVFKALGGRVDPNSLRPLYDALGKVAQQAVALQNEVAEAVRSPQKKTP